MEPIENKTDNLAAASEIPALIDRAVSTLNTIILGKDRQVRLCIACLLARGHLLIEDIPGVGKTMLAQAFARRAIEQRRGKSSATCKQAAC